MADFGTNLRALRQQKNMTQQELSDSMGISKSAINMYERGERQPNFETLELIADYFNVNIDFLLGKSTYIQCPICYNTYDPLNKYDSAEHDAFHKKFTDAESKYGKIILYGDACAKRENSIIDFRNPKLSFEDRISAMDNYLKYDFMVSIWESGFNLRHKDFDSYCQEELQKLQPDALISKELCEAIKEKYRVPSADVIFQFTTKDERDIKKDLDSLMEKLSSKEYGPAAFDGEDIPEDDQELFAGQVELMLRRLKAINKEKYNPNKNKK